MWFLFALGSAIGQSASQAFQNYAAKEEKLSKFFVLFCASAVGALILFIFSWYRGFPELHPHFWWVAAATAGINFITGPMLLRGYELADFSSVYSKILLTPVFMLGTSALLLGEIPSVIGIAGVVLTVAGIVYTVWHTRPRNIEREVRGGWISKGELLGIGVALLWSISANFDKLAAVYSDAFFGAAGSMLILAALYCVYLLAQAARGNNLFPAASQRSSLKFGGIVLGLGALLASVLVFQNFAFLRGFASYTIAIKRVGVLFAIVWGWLFFKERHIAQKLIGASIAVAGVILIIFA